MFIIRQAVPKDAEVLLKLAKMVYFINLPPDAKVIGDKIRWSRACFANVRAGQPPVDSGSVAGLTSLGGAAGASPQFMFVIENTDTGNPVGCCAAITQMGSETHPSVIMRLDKRNFFSKDLQTGATHVTATVELDTSGPSEIGGLILAPSFRGHRDKLGKQLSYARFHYIGLHRDRFEDKIIAEMMAAISDEGHNPFWEHCSRRFINLTYAEADRFCQKSREFMMSLLPREPLYLTLLPPEARAVVGEVGPDTVPARKMLESLGFEHRGKIDPFDAGPVLEAEIDDIPIVKSTRRVRLDGACATDDATEQAMISFDSDEGGGFRAIRAACAFAGDGAICLPREAIDALGAEEGVELGFTPWDNLSSSTDAGAGSAAGAGKSA